VLPAYREAGIALKEVVIDGGPEFKGEFAKACAHLKISVHRIQLHCYEARSARPESSMFLPYFEPRKGIVHTPVRNTRTDTGN
jgi:hypothetical protein